MNVATIFPLWPGNIGLMQAAVALPLVSYGVAYTTGFAFGLGLQMIEMSVGIGVGLFFLAREDVVRDAEADARAGAACTSCRRTSLRALAAPSLKGVLSARGWRRRSPKASLRGRFVRRAAGRGRRRGDARRSRRSSSRGRGARRVRPAATRLVGRAGRRHGGRRGGAGDPARPSRLEVRAASSRGLGELIAAVGTPRALVVGLGGTANMDAGAGLLEVLLRCRRRRASRDVDEAPRRASALRAAEGRDRGRRAGSLGALRGPSVRRAGGLGSRRRPRRGAGFARRGARPGRRADPGARRLRPERLRPRCHGRGKGRTTRPLGKERRRPWSSPCCAAGVPCVMFGGRVLAGDAVPLSGDPPKAYEDFVALGARLGKD